MKFVISNDPEALRDTSPDVTIEAEYGQEIVKGSMLTLGHHGPRQSNPAPCLYDGLQLPIDVVVGLSHVDLDTLGGIIRVFGIVPQDATEFWQAAAFIDVNGPHKINESGASEMIRRQLRAWWAWSEANRYFPPRKGIANVTKYVMKAVRILERILSDDPELIAAGEKWQKAQNKLADESFVDAKNGVVFRASDKFVNHLYYDDTGDPVDIIVGYNTERKIITVSTASVLDYFDCGKFMEDYFGPDAGGKAVIGGTPRNKKYSWNDAATLWRIIVDKKGVKNGNIKRIS